MKYLFPLLFIGIFISCQSNKDDKRSDAAVAEQISSKEQSTSKKISIDASLDVLEKIKKEETVRKSHVASLEEKLIATCVPSSVTDSIYVLIRIEPDGTPSITEVYRAPSADIKDCILNYIKNETIDFGQVTSAGTERNKSGTTLHELVLIGEK